MIGRNIKESVRDVAQNWLSALPKKENMPANSFTDVPDFRNADIKRRYNTYFKLCKHYPIRISKPLSLLPR